ncbi:MAG: FAD-dependent oxidoreductase, partial [Aeromicrobium sp.]
MADGASNNFDIVILGGGSGGYACALRAAQLGLTVVLIEKAKLGGTCLHMGCIPTKALLHSAEVADSARESDVFGVKATFEGIDMTKVNAFKDGVVNRLYKGLQGMIKGAGITVVEGEGKLVAKDTVEVNGARYTGKNVVLATGSYARTLPGLEIAGRVITSDEALGMSEVPNNVVIIGGSVIG